MKRDADLSRPRRYHPLLNLTLARIREFLREPHAVFWVYVFPLLLVATLGVAFRNRPLEAFRVVVVEGPQAESTCATLNRDSHFQASVASEAEARRQLRSRRADLMLAASSASPAGYDCFYDPNKAECVLARNSVDDCLERAAGRQDLIEVRDHPVDEQGGHYADFLVPGMLGMSLLSGGLWGVGYAVVDMRIRKLLKHYFATPVRRSHFLASVMLSRLVFTVTQVLVLLLFARAMFGVNCHGSYLALALVIFLGALQFCGVGLLVGSRAQTMETLSGVMNAIILPMWVGSGVFFSIERFPPTIQWAVQFLPLTPLVHALRGIMLDGTSLTALAGQVALVAAWGVGTFVLALRYFRWK